MKEIIVVEGRYDKNTVSQVIDATIIETSGFGLFSDEKKLALLRALAEKRGLIIFTDSDGAGFLIRNKLNGLLGGFNIKHAYIPDINGKEKRKREGSKEGKLGVEGMNPETILSALKRAGATFEGHESGINLSDPITKADMYCAGLSGKEDSARKRADLLERLELPGRLSANGLLEVLNALYSRDEFIHLFSCLNQDSSPQ